MRKLFIKFSFYIFYITEFVIVQFFLFELGYDSTSSKFIYITLMNFIMVMSLIGYIENRKESMENSKNKD